LVSSSTSLRYAARGREPADQSVIKALLIQPDSQAAGGAFRSLFQQRRIGWTWCSLSKVSLERIRSQLAACRSCPARTMPRADRERLCAACLKSPPVSGARNNRACCASAGTITNTPSVRTLCVHVSTRVNQSGARVCGPAQECHDQDIARGLALREVRMYPDRLLEAARALDQLAELPRRALHARRFWVRSDQKLGCSVPAARSKQSTRPARQKWRISSIVRPHPARGPTPFMRAAEPCLFRNTFLCSTRIPVLSDTLLPD